MLHIEADPAWVALQLDGMRRQALSAPAPVRMLTDGRTVTQDGEIVEDDGDGYWETDDQPQPQTIPGNVLTDESGQPYEPLDYMSGGGVLNGEASDDSNHDTGEDNPFETPQRLTAGQLRRLHALGTEVYGKANWDTKRLELVQAVTKGAAASASHLTPAEAAKLITGLEDKLQAEAIQSVWDAHAEEEAQAA
jgi:hypothetical protein